MSGITKAVLCYLAISASATFGFILGALIRGGSEMDDYGTPCKWCVGPGDCDNPDCPVYAEPCPAGAFAPVICENYERGDADADR